MFRAPADMIGDALQPPERVRFVQSMLGVYTPVAVIIGILQVFVLAIRRAAPDTVSAGAADNPTVSTRRSSVRRRSYAVVTVAVLSGAIAFYVHWLELTPQEMKAAEVAREELLPSFGGVLSPSGSYFARAYTARFADHNALELTVVAVDDDNRASLDAHRLLSKGITGGNNVVLSWTDESHLVVFGMLDGNPPSGPDSIGDVQVSYKPFVFGQVEGRDTQAGPVFVSDVSYSVEQAKMHTDKPDTPICTIHVQGTDGRFHRRIGINLIGIGVQMDWLGSSLLPYALMFDATDLPGAAEQMTLTQAMSKDVGYAKFMGHLDDADRFIVMPAQAHVLNPVLPDRTRPGRSHPFTQNVIYSAPILRERVTAMFDHFREGRYQAVFEFGAGRQVVTYAFDTPIPRSVAEQFQRCDATTEMTPPLVGSHLTSE